MVPITDFSQLLFGRALKYIAIQRSAQHFQMFGAHFHDQLEQQEGKFLSYWAENAQM
ncbi:hypothetical protein [Rhizobium leguminosarum]|uniref:hypothetical protein n=1 Tax=Rhizobium leguminosarum TaxID=384 RepID=UPI0013F1618A|nr:hypothetical protein [Rhizobium leguminosarum]